MSNRLYNNNNKTNLNSNYNKQKINKYKMNKTLKMNYRIRELNKKN